jgi:methionine biosynthesis protein MetW
MDTHEEFVENKFKKVSELIPEKSKILDIGCNDARILNFLKNPNYFGIDINNDRISESDIKKIKFKQADLNKDELPFKNEKFDFILLLDVLEHVVNPQKLLLEAKKKLSSSGKLIITLPNDYHLLNKIRFVFNKHLTENPFAPYGHLHYFPIKSGEKFLKENGFKIEKKIILSPVKPKIIPQSIKNFLSSVFPQAFARDMLYVLS